MRNSRSIMVCTPSRWPGRKVPSSPLPYRPAPSVFISCGSDDPGEKLPKTADKNHGRNPVASSLVRSASRFRVGRCCNRLDSSNCNGFDKNTDAADLVFNCRPASLPAKDALDAGRSHSWYKANGPAHGWRWVLAPRLGQRLEREDEANHRLNSMTCCTATCLGS